MSYPESNRFSARAARYARVGANVGGVAARFAAQQLTGGRTSGRDASNAAVLAKALGGLKGPLMKVAQLMATIPDLLPPEYADELAKLQSDAPPMGAAFVKRRMQAELGPDWQKRFKSFDLKPAAAASLGQVHRAVAPDGAQLACKLQYPDMKSAVEADLSPTRHSLRHSPSFRTGDRHDRGRQGNRRAGARGAGLPARGEERRALWAHAGGRGRRAYAQGAAGAFDRTAAHDGLARRREAAEFQIRAARGAQPHRFGHVHGLVAAVLSLRRHSRRPASRQLQRVRADGQGINLLDYGCVRIFPPKFVGGVVDLYRGLQEKDGARIVHAYETWGFSGLKKDVIETLNIWARFIYGPLLEDRVRSVADGVEPGKYGRREAFTVHQALKTKGPVKVPREFVFLDRAAVGLGAVFLHLGAELNYHRMFEAALGDFKLERLEADQAAALKAAGLT